VETKKKHVKITFSITTGNKINPEIEPSIFLSFMRQARLLSFLFQTEQKNVNKTILQLPIIFVEHTRGKKTKAHSCGDSMNHHFSTFVTRTQK
jgi:hypothetical protein